MARSGACPATIAVALLLATSAAVAGRAEPATYQAVALADGRVLTVTERLAVANASLCERRAWRSGLQLAMASQYAPSDRAAAWAAARIGDRPTIVALAQDGAALRAGLRVGDQVVAVDDVVMPVDPSKAAATFRRVDRATALLDGGLTAAGVVLTVERGAERLTLRLIPARGCDARAVVEPGAKLAAHTDGRDIAVSMGLVEAAATDAELAIVLGHEFAHRLLARRFVRPNERDADGLGLLLTAKAGYRPDAAITFWQRIADAGRRGAPGSPSPRHAARRQLHLAHVATLIERIGVDAARRHLFPNLTTELEPAQPAGIGTIAPNHLR